MPCAEESRACPSRIPPVRVEDSATCWLKPREPPECLIPMVRPRCSRPSFVFPRKIWRISASCAKTETSIVCVERCANNKNKLPG